MVKSRRMVSAWNCSTDFPRDRHGFHVWKFARVVTLRSICNYKHSAGRTAPPAVTTTLTVQDWGDPKKVMCLKRLTKIDPRKGSCFVGREHLKEKL